MSCALRAPDESWAVEGMQVRVHSQHEYVEAAALVVLRRHVLGFEIS